MRFHNLSFKIGALALSTFSVIFLSSCIQDLTDNGQKRNEVVYSTFDFATAVNKNIEITVMNMKNKSVSNVVVEVFFKHPYTENGQRDTIASPVTKLLTNSQGKAETVLNIPTYLSNIYVVTNFPGYANPDTISNVSKEINLTIHPAGYSYATN
ncbi:MAG: hypothetical protein PHR38_02840 [Bacteroidales bacterium]|nr:hypothetical protein [Bacteroidales bacterium]MDD3907180.1 hypothetical protein [Bacteroidales bacterium]MDD4713122.1 hypothetical protein [Bacteroidales bacterium]